MPGSLSELRLCQRDEEFSTRVDGCELMNSRVLASEAAFSELGCERIRGRKKARVLIGGLGLGYSLKAALDVLPRDAQVEVAELVPQVAAWNRDILGHWPSICRRETVDVKTKRLYSVVWAIGY